MEEKNTYQPKPEDFRFASQSPEIPEDNGYRGSDSFPRRTWNKFASQKANLAALILLFMMILLALFGPALSGYRFDQQNLEYPNLPPRIPVLENIGVFDGTQVLKKTTGTEVSDPYREAAIKEYHLFGSDVLGRDMFCRVFHGLRISLFVAVTATLINTVLGVIYGMVSGYFGGSVDMVMQRIIDVLGSIPQMIILTLLVLILKPGITTLIIAFMITGWIGTSRIARAEVLRLKEMEFVMASRTLGANGFFIIFHGILPNIMGTVISQIMVSIPTIIFMESALSLMGLGLSSGEISLGMLIQGGLQTFFLHPHKLVPSIIVMVLTMISCNRLADGIRYALDPNEIA